MTTKRREFYVPIKKKHCNCSSLRISRFIHQNCWLKYYFFPPNIVLIVSLFNLRNIRQQYVCLTRLSTWHKNGTLDYLFYIKACCQYIDILHAIMLLIDLTWLCGNFSLALHRVKCDYTLINWDFAVHQVSTWGSAFSVAMLSLLIIYFVSFWASYL